MNIESKIKFNNVDEVEHKLKSNQDGSFEVSAVPTRAGNYFVSFYKDGFKIEGFFTNFLNFILGYEILKFQTNRITL